jgi:hypothetical protein
MKVDFFIVGTQKGGTTALHSILSRISGIQMSSPKETHFFDDETIDWNSADYSRLHGCFDWNSQNVIRGEATPIYCYWPASIQRIHTYNPEAKIIMLLRHPAHRAYSHWCMEFHRGDETLQFEEAISEKGRLRVVQSRGGIHPVFSYIERGFYSQQIERIKGLFLDQNILFIRTDELWSNPQQTIKEITSFLGVQLLKVVHSEYIAPIINEISAIPSEFVRFIINKKLTDFYASDIKKTENLTGIHLVDWLEKRYSESIKRP